MMNFCFPPLRSLLSIPFYLPVIFCQIDILVGDTLCRLWRGAERRMRA